MRPMCINVVINLNSGPAGCFSTEQLIKSISRNTPNLSKTSFSFFDSKVSRVKAFRWFLAHTGGLKLTQMNFSFKNFHKYQPFHWISLILSLIFCRYCPDL